MEEKPYICFNCKKLARCKNTPIYSTDLSFCKNFAEYDYKENLEKTTIGEIANKLKMPSTMLYAKMRYNGWKWFEEFLSNKGIEIYRKKTYVQDKRYRKNNYVYYSRRK